MSNAKVHQAAPASGEELLLPRDRSEEELAAAPVLASADDLLIEGLTAEEHEAFLAALAR